MAKINKDNLNYFIDNDIDISTKTIYLGHGKSDSCDVDEHLAANVIKGLHILSSIRLGDPINIIINSQGGDTQHGLAIYDAIRLVSSPVHITVFGHCYSIAAWILQAGTIRRMTANSSLMIHDGEGTKSKFFKEQDIKCRDILLARIREKHPDFSVTKLQKMLDTDTYLWADQALALGLVDQVVE